MYEEIKKQTQQLFCEVIKKASLKEGDLLVVGCSSSEIRGEQIGKGSSVETAEAVFSVLYPMVQKEKIFLAAQCCEHLNRALIIERAAAEKYGYEPVSVVPKPKAGGSFATMAYTYFEDPVAVESVQAKAGIDIGETLIGMHLKAVAVPLRTEIRQIGNARGNAAFTRPKYIGGCRTHYE